MVVAASLALTPAAAECVPGGGDHDCCEEGSAGCNDEDCCSTVCNLDPFCCSGLWDNVCVAIAEGNCVGGCGPSCGNSDHDCCTVGDRACDDADCCSAVCTVDPFCCGIAWDSVCVDNAISLCGPCAPVDSDGDGITDEDESAGCTDPFNADTDGDGLSDGDELSLGTDPCNADTDGDGLSDGAEVDAAAGSGCPDPLNPDSDGDGISDGAEVTTLPHATNPCNADTDGDGLPDSIDPFPTDPGGTVNFIEDFLRDLCADINGLNPNLFNGPNTITKKLFRTLLAQAACTAANLVKCGNYNAAEAILEAMLLFVDGNPNPNDWMKDSPEQDQVKAEVEFMLLLLSFF